MKSLKYILILSFFTIHFSLAQEESNKKIKLKEKGVEKVYSTQAEEGDIKFTDGTPNTLLRITDEGDFGAIELKSGVPL